MSNLLLSIVSTFIYFPNKDQGRQVIQVCSILGPGLDRAPRCSHTTPDHPATNQSALTTPGTPTIQGTGFFPLSIPTKQYNTRPTGRDQGAAPPPPGREGTNRLYPNGHGVDGGFGVLKAQKTPFTYQTIFLKLKSTFTIPEKFILEFFSIGTNFCVT